MDRAAFLSRITDQLGRPSPIQAPKRTHVGTRGLGRRDATAGSVADEFAEQLIAVGGQVLFASGAAEAEERLCAALAELPVCRAIAWARSEFAGWKLDRVFGEFGARAIGEPGLQTPAEVRSALFSATVGITTADAAVASTGSVVLSAAPTRPRGVSLLPTLHVVLLREEQVVARPGDALAIFELRGSPTPSAVHFITGPSRTSDIENDLTIGVHGPAHVLVVLHRTAAGSVGAQP